MTTFSIKFYVHNSPSYFLQNDAQLGIIFLKVLQSSLPSIFNPLLILQTILSSMFGPGLSKIKFELYF